MAVKGNLPGKVRAGRKEDMKKIIDGKMYNTETAKRVGYYDNGVYGSFSYFEETCTEREPGNSSCMAQAMRIVDIANARTVIRQALRKLFRIPKKRRESGWSRTQALKSISRFLVSQTNNLNMLVIRQACGLPFLFTHFQTFSRKFLICATYVFKNI